MLGPASEEVEMAVGVLIMLPGVTEQNYEDVTKEIFGTYPMEPGNAPDGLLVHSAGPVPEGWYVYDIWESPEHFGRFGEERVGPAMAAVMGEGGPQVEPQFYEIHGFVQAR
jgi:hypothetical protein